MEFRFGRKAIALEEAQRIVLSLVRKQEEEQVSLPEAFGRRLARDVAADTPVPHFRRSGVDGFAVRASDCAAASPIRPATLTVVETLSAGMVPQRRLERGQAARIMTGGVVPDGADAVVMLEMTDRLEQTSELPYHVQICKSMEAGENVTPIGHEAQRGELLLRKGRRIGPGETAILAAFGHAVVPVFRRPRVAIFSTGSELLPVEVPLTEGKIRCSNSFMLAAQVMEAGGEPIMSPILPDDVREVELRLRAALESADAVVTTGGVSVGDKDVLVELFERWDGEVLFNKIKMRPGSPTSLGIWRGKPLFALSGNPGACYVGFELLMRPYLRAAMGSDAPLPDEATAILETDYRKGSAYPRYIRGTTRVEDGKLKVRPAGRDKSSIMVSIKDADCLICLPAGGTGAAQGELVRIMKLNCEGKE
ncbi:molybdopterin molybdotransferase MoeA [Paenibacillus filicis]|uniref:Molybdopterin molybdenumtransferase n=1 Tax=Paenibacillus gyeongsangnamensis TaxID=3388067 RepID=A0ABT4QLL0_9BACL|nr:gephyrin-like molybdotransferase Glp [Paenibacillus filicis]MCZ8517763.1 molybdopterin molybdotransferase MoeA [Paenibacillus filicis]